VAKPANDLRRLGTILVMGMIAGAGVRYWMESRARAAETAGVAGGSAQSPLIDWNQARRVALRVSQWEQAPIPDRAMRREQYSRLVQQSEPLIAQYLGVNLPQPINRIYVFDRREWLEANFVSFEQLFKPVEELYTRNGGARGAVAVVVNDINRQVLGTQVGALLGFLARRVLGQYDLSLLSPDPAVRGSLYYVEPNIARVQGTLGLNDEDFRFWIALHETTHAFQFEAYPWVRDYFNSLLRQYFDQLHGQLENLGSGLGNMLNRMLQNWGSGQHWVEMMLTPEQRRVFDRLQALMSVVEGYGNHIMNAIGRQLLPSFDQIEQRMHQRQQNRTLFEQLFNRITGLDLKLAQYQQGEAFVNAVVDARGIAFASRVWERPENLPTMEEIRNPTQWITRIDMGT
jgi:coenzyme F420 biosynthesis associated uncharacterized protein